MPLLTTELRHTVFYLNAKAEAVTSELQSHFGRGAKTLAGAVYSLTGWRITKSPELGMSLISEMKNEPNKAMETTAVAVTILAYARIAPSTSASHL